MGCRIQAIEDHRNPLDAIGRKLGYVITFPETLESTPSERADQEIPP
jgi:hypothetical protein